MCDSKDSKQLLTCHYTAVFTLGGCNCLGSEPKLAQYEEIECGRVTTTTTKQSSIRPHIIDYVNMSLAMQRNCLFY